MKLADFQRAQLLNSAPGRKPKYAVIPRQEYVDLLTDAYAKYPFGINLMEFANPENVATIYGVAVIPDVAARELRFAHRRACAYCGAEAIRGNRDSSGACASCGSEAVRYHWCRGARP